MLAAAQAAAAARQAAGGFAGGSSRGSPTSRTAWHGREQEWGVEEVQVLDDEEEEYDKGDDQADADGHYGEDDGAWDEEEAWADQSSGSQSSRTAAIPRNGGVAQQPPVRGSFALNASPKAGAAPTGKASAVRSTSLKGKPARLPEELGFGVSHGVMRKGWEIGEMEDGIRPVDDGEPDVFLSHSYTENCRRVDMALFECDCPNSLACCSHAYAGLVALPTYRHRAALMWQIQKECYKKAPQDFASVRGRVKASLLQRLPLDEVADAAIDATLGLWNRVDWLRKGREPKLEKYWSDTVDRAIGSKAKAQTPEQEKLGEHMHKQVADLLKRFSLKKSELAPLFLALGDGQCGSSRDRTSGKSAKDVEGWFAVCKRFWAHAVGELKHDGKAPPAVVTAADVRLATVTVCADAAVEIAEWAVLRPVDRLWRIEALVLQSLGVETFTDLRVPKQEVSGGADGEVQVYKGFLELVCEWPEAPEDLLLGGGGGGGDDGSGPWSRLIQREAVQMLDELGSDSLKQEGDVDAQVALAGVLREHFGGQGEAEEWSEIAAFVLKSADIAPTSRSADSSGAVLSAHSVAFESAGSGTTPRDNGPLLAPLATEGWEAAACRLLQAAPSLAGLRAWMLWDIIFESTVGSLKSFLRRNAGGLGVLALEVPGGEFLKLDASAGTGEVFSAALVAFDAARAAEALLALCHSCGGVRHAPLQEVLGPGFARAAESEGFPQLVGELMSCLPRPFVQSASILKFLLQPLGKNEEAVDALAAAAGPELAECAALCCPAGPASATVLAKRAARRLETGRSSNAAVLRGRPRAPFAPMLNGENSGGSAGSVLASARSSALPSTGSVAAPKPAAEAQYASVATPTSSVLATAVVSASSQPVAASELSSDPAEALVQLIRLEEFGFRGEALTGGDLQVKQNSRLARALKRLAGELYGSDVHWQLELLQNADDNTYDEELEPTAEFMLRPGEVVFRCNERGFREADIRSICDIGNSSKVGTAKYGAGGRVIATGEKGLGFKAVFALTNAPRVLSGAFRIEFDALHPSGIGYVLPRWLGGLDDAVEAEDLLEGGWGSALRLPLRPELLPRQSELFTQLQNLPGSLLLFLKQLRELSVSDCIGSASGDADAPCGGLQMRRADELETGGASTRWHEATLRANIEISRGGGPWESERWLLLRRKFLVPPGVAKPGVSSPPETTLIEVALPLDDEEAFDRTRGAQPVFAFLPVRSFGLSFALQADWAVSSSREELLSGCAWNEFIKAQLPKLMLELVEAVKKEGPESSLRWSFYSMFPSLTSAPAFFRAAVAQIHAALRGHECMLTDQGAFCIPRMAFRCSAEVRAAFAPMHGRTSPLRAALESQGFHIVHDRVEATVHAGLLDSLGVQRFAAGQLLRLLPTAIEAAADLSFWRRVLALTDELLDSAQRSDVARLVDTTKKLPLLPLEGGSWASAEKGVFLPPAQDELKSFPHALLVELCAVDPRLLADNGGDEVLVTARVRKLLQRLGVAPLTPRHVLRDIIAPLYKSRAPPCYEPMSLAPKSMDMLLAFCGFIASHAELADELGNNPVGWPAADHQVVLVGKRFMAPAIHSPRAASYLDVLRGSPVKARLPALPPGTQFSSDTALGEALEILGLALPGPLVEVAPGNDWKSSEFERLALHVAREGKAGLAKAKLLAQALDTAWPRYERYLARADGEPSSFLVALRSTCWLPLDRRVADDADVEIRAEPDAPEEPEDSSTDGLRRPSDLVVYSPSLRAVFTDAALLAGRLTSAVSGKCAETLGVVTEPSPALTVAVLRSFGQRSPVGPEAATALYAYLERQPDAQEQLLGPLRRSKAAVVVLERGQPAQPPNSVVWEDVGDACALPALLPLYGSRWRSFFVDGLGVPEQPTAEQALRRLDLLLSSGEDVDPKPVYAALLFVAGRVASARASAAFAGTIGGEGEGEQSPKADADAGSWLEVAASLKSRRCLPLVGGGFGAAMEGVVYTDDCPQVPVAVLKDAQANLNVVAMPPSGMNGAVHWFSLLWALGLRPLSEACTVSVSYDGLAKPAHVLSRTIAALLPVAERYLYHMHRPVYDAIHLPVVARVQQLVVRYVDPPLRLACNVTVREGDAPTMSTVTVDAFLQGPTSDSPPSFRLLAVPEVQMPTICVELSRLLVPPVSTLVVEVEESAAKHAREALTPFLISAAAGVPAELCRALGVGELPSEVSRWPLPEEVSTQLASEARLLAAAEEAETANLEGNADEGIEGPSKKRRLDSEPKEGLAEGSTGGGSDGGGGCGSGEGSQQDGDGDDRGAGKFVEDGEPNQGDGCKGGKGGKGGKKGEDGTGSGAEGGMEGKEGKGKGKGIWKDGKGHGGGDRDPDAADRGDHEFDDEGAGGEGKGKGKGGKGPGKGRGEQERDASNVGDVFSGLPARLTGDELQFDPEKKSKAFKTRVYDIEDVREHTKQVDVLPILHKENENKEGREKTGRWGEQFVYAYLKNKLEADADASGGEEKDQKRVVWVNEHEETGFQYDLRIESASSGEVEAFVEVKTTQSKEKHYFEMSYREWTFAQKEGNRFVVFRVSNAGKRDVELCSITNPFKQWKDQNMGMCLSL